MRGSGVARNLMEFLYKKVIFLFNATKLLRFGGANVPLHPLLLRYRLEFCFVCFLGAKKLALKRNQYQSCCKNVGKTGSNDVKADKL
jgi:hypothetical protein